MGCQVPSLDLGISAAHIYRVKMFTAESANRTLPLVSRIVGDIVSQHARWRQTCDEYELLAGSVRADRPDPRAATAEMEMERLAREIDSYERELDELGIILKDRQAGLVDFPGELEGRVVLLCWRLGESAVTWWHEVDAGYAGRQRLQPHAVA